MSNVINYYYRIGIYKKKKINETTISDFSL